MFIARARVLFRRFVGAQQRNVARLRRWANRSSASYKHFAFARRRSVPNRSLALKTRGYIQTDAAARSSLFPNHDG
jgi:hypothetical protein